MKTVLEYVFFDERPRDGFVRLVEKQGLKPLLKADDDLLYVLLPEEISDELSKLVEAHYDRMMTLNQTLFETESDPEAVGDHVAGITLQLQDGKNAYARVDPVLLARIMEVVTPEEFNSVVNAIVEAVENPDTRSPCQRLRDERNRWE